MMLSISFQKENQVSEAYLKTLTRQKTSTIETTIIKWIQRSGLWLGPTGRGINLFAKISIICYFITNVAQIIALVKGRNDPERLFACFSVLSFCGMGFIKLTSLHFKKNGWCYLLDKAFVLENDQLNNDDTGVNYESDDEEDNTFAPYIILYTGRIRSSTKLLSNMYFFTAVVYILSPFIEYTVYGIQGKECTLYDVHVLPIWSPFDGVSFIGYIFTLIVEIVASVYCVIIHITFDSFATGTMILICGQFSLLREYSKHIGGSGFKHDLNLKRDVRAHYRIKKCHFIHVTLLNIINQLDDLTRNIIGVYFTVATLTLCSVAVQLQSTDSSATQLISLLQYLSATLIQLLLYCYYGHAVQNGSAIFIGDGPFTSSWWCLSGKVRREIAILCTGMSQSRQLNAGPFNTLNLQSFIQIVKAAYSYYTVLRQTSE